MASVVASPTELHRRFGIDLDLLAVSGLRPNRSLRSAFRSLPRLGTVNSPAGSLSGEDGVPRTNRPRAMNSRKVSASA